MTVRKPFETSSSLKPLFALLCGWMLQASQPQAAGAEFTVGQPLPPWQKGQLDIHQINTGLGDAALFVLPDGTSMLLDAGAVLDRKRPPKYDAPPVPNGSRRGGEWIAHYIRNVHPAGAAAAALDYAIITHFHSDHMGTLKPDAPRSATGAYQLAGITDVGDQIPIRVLIDRVWPDYSEPRLQSEPAMTNYREFQRWHREHRGMRVERFEAGRNDQIVLVHAPKEFPQFEIRNIAVNGYIWTGTGSETRNRFPESDPPDENNRSMAFRLRYGKFDYFNGGDMAGEPSKGKAWREMETAVAWMVGPVDAYALNHHGTKDATNAFFLSVLQPRIHISSIYAASQPGPDVMRRMLSQDTYPGPRDIFLTNAIWEGRRNNMVVLFGEEDAAWLESQIKVATGSQGHVVVRVATGGDSYHVLLLDDRDERMLVKSVHGPYQSR